MEEVWRAAAGAAAAALLVLLAYLTKRTLWSAIRLHTRARVCFLVETESPGELEQTVKGLAELRDRYLRNADILIETAGKSKELIRMAGILAAHYDGIRVR